jgi:hypothetical protein
MAQLSHSRYVAQSPFRDPCGFADDGEVPVAAERGEFDAEVQQIQTL